MILLSAHGYYYTVEDPNNEKAVIVYAHRESDLMYLVNHHCMIAGSPTRTGWSKDHRYAKTPAVPTAIYFKWQVRMTKEEWATGVARIALEMDYADLETVYEETGDHAHLGALDAAAYQAFVELNER